MLKSGSFIDSLDQGGKNNLFKKSALNQGFIGPWKDKNKGVHCLNALSNQGSSTLKSYLRIYCLMKVLSIVFINFTNQ